MELKYNCIQIYYGLLVTVILRFEKSLKLILYYIIFTVLGIGNCKSQYESDELWTFNHPKNLRNYSNTIATNLFNVSSKSDLQDNTNIVHYNLFRIIKIYFYSEWWVPDDCLYNI